MLTEADTCRKYVVPLLQKAGWDEDPHSIAEQRYFTDGRIIVRGNKAERRKGKRADYLLRYTRDFPIAVVEAKADEEHASEMRTALNNLNADLVQQFPDYVCRVTADEGDIGRGHTQQFQGKAEGQRLNAKVNPNPATTPSAFSLQPLAFSHAPEAREILNDLLEKYASDGELKWVAVRKHLPDVLKVPPISHHGNVNEIIGKFGSADQLRNAVNQLQSLLYAA